MWSHIRDSAILTQTLWDGSTAIKVELSVGPISLFSRMDNSSEVYRRNNYESKTLPCGTHDTTLTSLLRQPSTITCCNRFDRNCQYRQHETFNTNQAELAENYLQLFRLSVLSCHWRQISCFFLVDLFYYSSNEQVLGKYSCMNFTFSMALPTFTCSFYSVKSMKIWK